MAAGEVQRRPSQPCCDAQKGGGAEQRTHKGRRLPATAAQTQTKAPVIPRGSAPGRALTGARGCNRGARLPPPSRRGRPPHCWARVRRGHRHAGGADAGVWAHAPRRYDLSCGHATPPARGGACRPPKGKKTKAAPQPHRRVVQSGPRRQSFARTVGDRHSCGVACKPPQGALARGVGGDNAQDLVLEGEPSRAPSRRAVEESPSARNRRGPAYLARSFTARTAQVRACSTVILRWISPSSLELRTGIQSRLQGRCVRVARHELARVCQISVTQIGTQVEVYAVFADTDPNVVER